MPLSNAAPRHPSVYDRRPVRAVFAAFVVLSSVAVAASCAEDPASSPSPPDASVADGVAAPPDGAAQVDAGDATIDAPAPLVNTCTDAGSFPETWLADPRLCLTVFADALSVARQMAFAPNGDLFVQAAGNINVLFDDDKSGAISDSERATFATSVEGYAELNHGLAFSPNGAFVYASNDGNVFRWPYAKGNHVATGPATVVVKNVPPGAGHTSRTLAFDPQGRLYVNVGTEGDVDQFPGDENLRGMVRRFTIPASLPAGGIDYVTGEIYASGMRNEVGLSFDSKGRLWGVENGSDGIDGDNPGEEINRLDGPGSRFFGHNLCWTEYALDGGLGRGTQWAYRGYAVEQTDAWCRDTKNVHPPAAVMQGHWAPLGVAEYTGASLPWKGDLIVASHGSSSRDPAVGRVLARAHVVGDSIQGAVTPIVGHAVDGGLEQGKWEVRPVDVRSGPDGALYFSDDLGSRVFRLGYRP